MKKRAGRLPVGRQSSLVLAALLALLVIGGGSGAALPTGFQETTVFTGLANREDTVVSSDFRSTSKIRPGDSSSFGRSALSSDLTFGHWPGSSQGIPLI